MAARGDHNNLKDYFVAVQSDHSIRHQILDVMNSDDSHELAEPASARGHRCREGDGFFAAQSDHSIWQHCDQILDAMNSDVSPKLVETAGERDENRKHR